MLNRTTRYDPKAKHASLYWQYAPVLTLLKQGEMIKLREMREMMEMTQEDLFQTSIRLINKTHTIKLLTEDLRNYELKTEKYETVRLREMLEMSQEDLLQKSIKMAKQSLVIESLTKKLEAEQRKTTMLTSIIETHDDTKLDEVGDFDFCE